MINSKKENPKFWEIWLKVFGGFIISFCLIIIPILYIAYLLFKPSINIDGYISTGSFFSIYSLLAIIITIIMFSILNMLILKLITGYLNKYWSIPIIISNLFSFIAIIIVLLVILFASTKTVLCRFQVFNSGNLDSRIIFDLPPPILLLEYSENLKKIGIRSYEKQFINIESIDNAKSFILYLGIIIFIFAVEIILLSKFKRISSTPLKFIIFIFLLSLIIILSIVSSYFAGILLFVVCFSFIYSFIPSIIGATIGYEELFGNLKNPEKLENEV